MPRVLEVAERKLGDRCCDRAARPSIPERDALRLAEDFALLAHPIRLQLLDVLARNEGRVCVCDLESCVAVKQPTVSHHLRILREAGLVESEKIGLWAYYRVNRDVLETLRSRLAGVLESIG
jgi:ArsR family transcriptional regulator, arsenate/arsenite/antimonite-responsive transcriptional repressor